VDPATQANRRGYTNNSDFGRDGDTTGDSGGGD